MVNPIETSKCFFCCKEDRNLLKITDDVLGSKLGVLLASIGNLKVVPLTPVTLQATFCISCAEDVALAEEIVSKVRHMLDVPSDNASRNPQTNFTYECIVEPCTFATLKPHMLRRHHERTHPDSLEQAIFKCPHCGDTHKRPSSLHKHIEAVHSRDEVAVVKVELPADDASTGKHQFRCTKCNYSTKSAKVYKKHHRYKHGDTDLRVFPCPYCREVYQRVGALRNHINGGHAKAAAGGREIKEEQLSVKTEATPQKTADEPTDSSMLNATQSAIEFITDSDADESNLQCDGDVPVLMSEDIFTRLRQANEARQRQASLNSTDASPVEPAKRRETKTRATRTAKVGGKPGKRAKSNADAGKSAKTVGGIAKFLKFRDQGDQANAKPNGNDEDAQLNGVGNEQAKEQIDVGENNHKKQDDKHKGVESNPKEQTDDRMVPGNTQNEAENNHKDDLGNNQKNKQSEAKDNNRKGLKRTNKRSPKKLSLLKPVTRRNSKKDEEELDAMSARSPVKIPQIGKIYMFNGDTEEDEVEPARSSVPPKRAEAVKFLKFTDADVNPIEDDKDVDGTEDEGVDDVRSCTAVAEDSEAAGFLEFTPTQENSSQPARENGIIFLKFSDDKEPKAKDKANEGNGKESEANGKEDGVKGKEVEAEAKADGVAEKEDAAKEPEVEGNTMQEIVANVKKENGIAAKDMSAVEIVIQEEIAAFEREAIAIKQEPVRDSDPEDDFVAATQQAKKKPSESFTRQAATFKFAKFKDSAADNNESVPSSGLDTPEKPSKPTLTCPKCPFVTQSRKRFARHSAQAHGSSDSEQPSGDASTSVAAKKRKRSVGDDTTANKRIACSGCEKTFRTTVKLHAHLASEHAMVEVHQQLRYQQAGEFTL